MNHLVEVRKSLQCCWICSWNKHPPPPAALSREACSCSSPEKQMDWMAGSGDLWRPAQSPGHSKAPTFHLTHDLRPWPCGQHESGGGKGSIGIRLPGPGPQMKESLVSIPHAHLWGPGSCRTGISPNPGSWYGCVDKLYLQSYMCMCGAWEPAAWLLVPGLPSTCFLISRNHFASGASVSSSVKWDSRIPGGAQAGVGSAVQGRGLWGGRRQASSIIPHATTPSQRTQSHLDLRWRTHRRFSLRKGFSCFWKL